MNEFCSVLKPSETLIEIEKSKFIAHVQPVETENEAVDFIQSIKKKHNNATHNVTAFYIRDNYFCKRYSDDGEPSGTAGMPSLQTIVNKNIIDVCVVVTRYFGGIKLGTGGLARAYSEATAKGLENSKIIYFRKMYNYSLCVDYEHFNSLQYHLKKKNILLDSIEYEENIIITIFLDEEEKKILDELVDLTSSRIKISFLKETFIAQEEGRILARKDV